MLLGLFVLAGVFAPLLAPYDPVRDQSLTEKFAPPSAAHILGQDELGRDILSRLIYGARISLTAGLAAVGGLRDGLRDPDQARSGLRWGVNGLAAHASDGRYPAFPSVLLRS